jgi:quercetin dioxygenase-like cupin family protein
MQPSEFEAALRQDGFSEIDTRFVVAQPTGDEHTHPFDVRALVLEGDITLTVHGTARTYRAGEVFTMARDCPHSEAIGPDGVQYIVGRKRH